MTNSESADVGLLLLESTYMDLPGGMGHASTFTYPVVRHMVPGAQTSIVAGPNSAGLESTYAAAARQLEAGGAKLIASNCGFSVVFQEPIAKATSVPVMTSALLLGPLLNTVFGGKLGVLTFDATQIDARRREASGWPSSFEPAIADVQECAEWRKLSLPERPVLNYELMRSDLIDVASALVEATNIRALLLECTAMLPFESDLYECTKLPVFGLPSFLDYLHGRLAGEAFANQPAKSLSP